MKVVVAGASGLVGGKLVAELLESAKVTKVICLVRREFSLPQYPSGHRKLAFKMVDFNHLPSPTEEAEVGFCCLGTTMKKAGSREAFRLVDHDFVMNFAGYCLAASVRHFSLVSSVGARAGSPFFYNRVKGATEDGLRSLSFSRLSIYRPSLLVGERKEARLGEDAATVVYKMLGKGALKAWLGTEVKNLVGAMVTGALGEGSGNGVEVIGPREIG